MTRTRSPSRRPTASLRWRFAAAAPGQSSHPTHDRRGRRAGELRLVARDRGLVWHPYAALDGPAPYAVLAADGVRLTLRTPTGTRFEAIDAMSSWWCAIHGYRNPVLDAALREQAARFSHVMFGGLTHEPAVALAEQLVALAPAPLRARVLRRLGLGVGRGRAEARGPVPGRGGPAGAAAVRGAARRLSRRHHGRDEHLRPGRRDALAVPGPGGRAAVSAAARRRRRTATVAEIEAWTRPRARRCSTSITTASPRS